MDLQVIGMIAAGIGVLATIAYIVLGVAGVKALRDIAAQRRGGQSPS